MEFYTNKRESMKAESSTCDDKRVYLEVTRRISNTVNEIFVYIPIMFTSNFYLCLFPKTLGFFN